MNEIKIIVKNCEALCGQHTDLFLLVPIFHIPAVSCKIDNATTTLVGEELEGGNKEWRFTLAAGSLRFLLVWHSILC